MSLEERDAEAPGPSHMPRYWCGRCRRVRPISGVTVTARNRQRKSLMSDELVDDLATDHPALGDPVELLRRHVVDWGDCDDVDNCSCSHAQAVHFLDELGLNG